MHRRALLKNRSDTALQSPIKGITPGPSKKYSATHTLFCPRGEPSLVAHAAADGNSQVNSTHSVEPVTTLEVVVRERVLQAQDIISIELVSLDGSALPPFSAGAHLDLYLDDGLIRQYSLCNAPVERHRYLLGVMRDNQSRGGSKAVHDRLHEGQRLRIGVPRNNFALQDNASQSLLIAGGIGITPMLAMAHHLSLQGSAFTLHCCVRERARLPFQSILAGSTLAPYVKVHCDDAVRLLPERDLGLPAAGKHLYVCGPSAFMEFVIGSARVLGWEDANIHWESFTPVTQNGAALTVIAARSGSEVVVEENQSIARALIAAGIDVPLSCEQGMCGTCLTTVLAGTPEHRDAYLTDAERARNDCMTLCCSRALSATLTLDI